MSSFICSPKHYNSIGRKLLTLLNDSEFNSYGLKKFGLYRYDVNQYELKTNISTFLSGLRELNVIAVMYQYAHQYNGNFDTEITKELAIIKQPTTTKDLTNLGLYNALCCVSYQIEIERIKDKREDLIIYYQFLQDLINAVSRHICNYLEVDKSNRWSIN